MKIYCKPSAGGEFTKLTYIHNSDSLSQPSPKGNGLRENRPCLGLGTCRDNMVSRYIVISWILQGTNSASIMSCRSSTRVS